MFKLRLHKQRKADNTVQRDRLDRIWEEHVRMLARILLDNGQGPEDQRGDQGEDEGEEAEEKTNDERHSGCGKL